jgi:Formyl transferase
MVADHPRDVWCRRASSGPRIRRRGKRVPVHYVTVDYDAGELIARQELPVQPDDTAESLAARVPAVERVLLPELVRRLAAEVGSALLSASRWCVVGQAGIKAGPYLRFFGGRLAGVRVPLASQ